MVNPIYIFIVSLAAGFLLSVIDKAGRKLSLTFLYGILLFNFALMLGWFYQFAFLGKPSLILHTAGFLAPLSINLKLGLIESFILLLTNLTGLMSAIFLYKKFNKISVSGLILYLILIMGVNGLVITRDLFNIFVFLEIVSISTYALISLDENKRSFSSGFKYMLAGGITSTFFLLGVIFIYYFSGNLNLDQIISNPSSLAMKTGIFSVFILIVSVFVELKQFPANGWALDVYEAVNSGIVSVIAVVNSAAILFVFYKILPLLPKEYLTVFIGAGFVTFLFSNLMGIKQTNPKRLLGYSSIAQMGLVVAIIAFSFRIGLNNGVIILIAGGFFLNHFLAKAGLFWLTGIVNENNIKNWSTLKSNIPLLLFFGVLLFALSGLPPFPGFWSKWELVKILVSTKFYLLLTVLLVGSLFEAFYLFRWFGFAVKNENVTELKEEAGFSKLLPITVFVLMIFLVSFWIMTRIYLFEPINYLPIAAVFGMYLINSISSKFKAIISLIAVGTYGYYLYPMLTELQSLFGLIFIIGSGIIIISTMNRKSLGNGFYGFLLMMIFALGNLIVSNSYLTFFLNWEFMTISSYLLILRGKQAKVPALTFLTFSLAGAYLMLAGFSFAPFIASKASLISSITTIKLPLISMILLSLGFLIKSGSLGVHIWVPGAYAEAEDDMAPFISSVLSKAGVFGILIVAISFVRHSVSLDIFYIIGWLGVLTAIVGAFLAAFQEDAKRLLAYSSMSQLGYIIASIGLLSHLGWISGLYLTVNHFMFKALIFIAMAGVISRTGTRDMYKMGGLIKKMPISYISVLIGIIAVSGVPPLSGFGSKWLLYTAFIEKGWFLQAGVLFFASGVSFLYLYRLIHTVFLGQLKYEHQKVKEAPIWYLIPQVVFIMGIMAISMFPNLIITPLNNIVGNYFSSTIQIEGYKVTSSLGYWNGNMVMMVTMGVFMIPLIFLLLLNGRAQKVKQFNIVYSAERPESPQTTHFAHNMFSHMYKALGGLTKPRIQNFWNSVSDWSNSLAGLFRQFYTGNGQTYLLHILLYIIVLYIFLGV